MSNPTKKSYAEQVSRAQVMSAALKTNLEALKTRGMTGDFIKSLDGNLGKAVDLNSEQERLKSALKATTGRTYKNQKKFAEKKKWYLCLHLSKNSMEKKIILRRNMVAKDHVKHGVSRYHSLNGANLKAIRWVIN